MLKPSNPSIIILFPPTIKLSVNKIKSIVPVSPKLSRDLVENWSAQYALKSSVMVGTAAVPWEIC